MNRRSFLQSIAACVAGVAAFRAGKANAAPKPKFVPWGPPTAPNSPPAPPEAYRYIRYHATIPGTTGVYSSSRCITGASGSNDMKTWHEIWASPTITEVGK